MRPLQPRFGLWPRDELHFTMVLVMMVATSISISASQIALGLALALLLWRRFKDRTPLAGNGLGTLTLALAGWALLNIPFSNDPGQSVIYYRRFYLFAAIWAVASVADSDTRRRWILAAMVCGSVIISLFGLVGVYRSTGAFWVKRLGDMSNPMTSGCLLMLVLLVVIGFLLIPRFQGRLRLGLAVAALPLAFGLMQTMTRSAWSGFVIGLAAMLLLMRPWLLGFFAAMLVTAILVLPGLPDGVLGGRLSERLDLAGILDHHNTSVRLEMWQAGWRMIKARPWLGYGDHDLARTSTNFYSDTASDTVRYGHLHNNQIMLAVIWGIPGFLLAMAYFARQLALLLKRWRAFKSPDSGASPEQKGWVLGAIGVWVGFFVAGLTEWYFGDAESMLLYLAIIGAALGSSPAVCPALKNQPSPP